MIASAKSSKCKHDERWSAFTQKDFGEAFDRSQATIQQWIREGCPRYPAGKNRWRYCVPCAIAWLANRDAFTLTAAVPDDVLAASGGNSPALERWRSIRAEMAQLELEQRQRSLMPRDQVRSALARIASVWRQLGERLAKRHGPEAGESVRDAIADSQRVIDDEFGCNGHHETGDP